MCGAVGKHSEFEKTSRTLFYCCHDVWTQGSYLCTASSLFGHRLTLLAGLTFCDQNWKWRFSLILMFGSSQCEKWKFWWGLFGRWQHFASCSIWPRPARRSSSSSTCRGWSSVSWTRSQTISAGHVLSPGTAKKICAGTPRITRGMGTNITLEPGERVSLSFIVTLDIASGESCFSHLDLVIGQTSSFPIYENIKQVSKITTFKFSFCSGGYWF